MRSLRRFARSSVETMARKDMACYWIGVVSRDHVQAGVRGGFAQLGHGKAAPVRRLARGDRLVYYSPRTAYPDGPALQAFTAIGEVGEVIDDAPEQVAQTPGFHPYRRRVRFLEANEAPIAPLLDSLSFTRDKTNWGISFRRSYFQIPQDDFILIERAMQATE